MGQIIQILMHDQKKWNTFFKNEKTYDIGITTTYK